jgi:hypothetical protein
MSNIHRADHNGAISIGTMIQTLIIRTFAIVRTPESQIFYPMGSQNGIVIEEILK